MESTSLVLRIARIEDAEDLRAFYAQNPNRFLLPRPFAEFQTAIERGQFFVISAGEDIVAASGVFDYADNQPFVELAETFVSDGVRGFGMQGLFFRLRIGSVILTQGPSVGITTAVDPGNSHSLHTTDSQGFAPWTTAIPEAFANCGSCPNKTVDRRCCCDFYVLPVDKARAAVKGLLDETASSFVILGNNRDRELRIFCMCRFLHGEERRALEEFASGMNW